MVLGSARAVTLVAFVSGSHCGFVAPRQLSSWFTTYVTHTHSFLRAPPLCLWNAVFNNLGLAAFALWADSPRLGPCDPSALRLLAFTFIW